MTERQPDSQIAQERIRDGAVSRKIDAIGWGLFFVWIGVALLLDVGWGWGMLGIAGIILGEALVRKRMGLKVEGFWVVVGILFLAAGIWELADVPLPLAPFAIIAIGLAVLWGAFSGKHMMKK